RQRLEAASTRYEKWSAATTSIREAGAKARAELERRSLARQPAGQRQPGPDSEPPAMAGWWQQLETDSAAAGTALEREHQAAIAAGRPWSPRPERELETSSAAGHEPGRRAAWLDEL